MSLKIRRLIYLFFILIFLISAPILILYAAGYRYNFQKTKFQKTGALFIETLPKLAAIFIEDKPEQNKTPTQINNLLAGDYSVKLTKEGYFDWQKKLPIYPETVTFAKAVVLFKNNTLSSRLIGQPILSALTSADNRKMIAAALNESREELWLVNLERSTAELLPLAYQPEEKFELAGWAPSDKKILIKQTIGSKINYLIINPEKPEEIINLADFASWPKNPKQLKWDAANDNYLYAQSGNAISKINLAVKTIEELKIKTGGDFLINDDFLYSLPTKSGASYLSRQSVANPATPENLLELPNNGDYSFLGGLGNLIALADPISQNLLVIDLGKNEIILNAKAKAIRWSADRRQLLYYNDLEIWVYYPTDQNKELITRYSQPIKEVIWYPLSGYLIFSQKIPSAKNALTIIELDSRDYRQTIKLLEAETIDNLAIDPKGENLFFTAKIGNQEGLYSLNIH